MHNNEPLNVDEIRIALMPVSQENILEGEPEVGEKMLTHLGELEIGLWEMNAGTTTDTEVDEVFLVLEGVATIAVLETEKSTISKVFTVGPHDLVRLQAGTRTRWHVSDTLKKLYIAQ